MKAKLSLCCLLCLLLLVVSWRLTPTTAVSAQADAVVVENGALTITLAADADIILSCVNGEVRINNQGLVSGTAVCTHIVRILIQGSDGDNMIDVAEVTKAAFPSLTAVTVYGHAGNDRFMASEFSDSLFGGDGDDLFVGTQPNDLVDTGPGNDLFMEATQPLGPGPTAPIGEPPLRSPALQAPVLLTSFAGPDFLTNATHTGSYFIPPDSSAAAGPDHVVSVVNVTIQWHTKAGVNEHDGSLASFFSSASPAPTTRTFDPKVIYDQYEDRFVVVTLEKVDSGSNPSASNVSRIYLAVSDDGNPNGTWYYQVIDAKVTDGGFDYWFDYPGFAIDEDAIYITGNMFRFVTNAGATFNRLWIVDKGVVGGLYSGGSSSTFSLNPAGVGYTGTHQPAHVFGAGGVPGVGPIGTFLVNYSGLTSGGLGGTEWLSLIRVNDPVGVPTLSASTLAIGNIEDIGGVYGYPDLPDAPQSGTATLVEVNDRRALHAVWRDDRLWLTTTINPNSGADSGQTTAHWWHLGTSAVPAGAITLVDQGNIGGEDVATGAYTFFPSVAIDPCGNAGFGFSASAATIYPGAYYTVRYASDPASTVQTVETLMAGVDYYYRAFGGSRNRWGDYSGMALDPDNEATFWAFNEYAMTRGSVLGSYPLEDGRWATQVGSFASGIDFGDLPPAYGNTTFADDGARHCIGSIFLGSGPDADGDGQESLTAVGDSTDEDGVDRDMTDPWLNGAGVDIEFDLTSSAGPVDIGLWIDWNGNDTFDAGTDFFPFTGVAAGGVSVHTITVPGAATYTLGSTVNARVRVFAAGGAPGGSLDATDYVGLATNGEVEDYQWGFTPTAVSLQDVTAVTHQSKLVWLVVAFGTLLSGALFWQHRKNSL